MTTELSTGDGWRQAARQHNELSGDGTKKRSGVVGYYTVSQNASRHYRL